MRKARAHIIHHVVGGRNVGGCQVRNVRFRWRLVEEIRRRASRRGSLAVMVYIIMYIPARRRSG